LDKSESFLSLVRIEVLDGTKIVLAYLLLQLTI
jgi:hypothetical protein